MVGVLWLGCVFFGWGVFCVGELLWTVGVGVFWLGSCCGRRGLVVDWMVGVLWLVFWLGSCCGRWGLVFDWMVGVLWLGVGFLAGWVVGGDGCGWGLRFPVFAGKTGLGRGWSALGCLGEVRLIGLVRWPGDRGVVDGDVGGGLVDLGFSKEGLRV